MDKPNLYYIDQTFRFMFDFFNENLFENILPQAEIEFCNVITKNIIEPGQEKIYINVKSLLKSSKNDLTSAMLALVHEMVHLYTHTPDNIYHTKPWKDKMLSMGIETKSNGRFVDYIPDSYFLITCNNFMTKFNTDYNRVKIDFLKIVKKEERKTHRKIKYLCDCNKPSPIWASKKGLNVLCLACNQKYTQERMK